MSEVAAPAEDGVGISKDFGWAPPDTDVGSLWCYYSIPKVAVPAEDVVDINKDLTELLQILKLGLFDAITIPEVAVPVEDGIGISKDFG